MIAIGYLVETFSPSHTKEKPPLIYINKIPAKQLQFLILNRQPVAKHIPLLGRESPEFLGVHFFPFHFLYLFEFFGQVDVGLLEIVE